MVAQCFNYKIQGKPALIMRPVCLGM